MKTNYDKIPQLESVNVDLKEYIETEIFPRYEKFFSHGIHHIHNVITNALMLAEYYYKDFDIAYAAAAFHDLGLKVNREQHELASGEIIAKEKRLEDFFSPAEIAIIREAAEDHRGSRKIPPRSFYGRIISDSDRDFELATLAWRTLATSTKNYLDLTTFDEHFSRCYEYISQRLAKDGHFNLWTNNPILIGRREDFEQEFFDCKHCREVYLLEWERLEADGSFEKILNNYYEDF